MHGTEAAIVAPEVAHNSLPVVAVVVAVEGDMGTAWMQHIREMYPRAAEIAAAVGTEPEPEPEPELEPVLEPVLVLGTVSGQWPAVLLVH